VLRRLREEGFTADIAYPGQKAPILSGPVAAVHIDQVDRANLTVTVRVSILCPAALGGTACEVEALRATEVLRWSGAVCVQNGCSYDGIAQVYVVDILASFTGVTEAESCVIWPGFYAYVNERIQRFAVGFSEEEVTQAQAEYAMGVAAPAGISTGSHGWNVQLEELIPAGSAEAEAPVGAFRLKIVTDQKTVVYSGCQWTSVRREFTRQGLRRVRKGIALERKEEENGQSEL